MTDIWKFSEINHIEEASFNKVLERFYGSGVEGLVKENIQNSLDAKLNNQKPVKVRIETGTIKVKQIPGIKEILNRIDALKGGNSYTEETIVHMQKMAKAKECGYISFEDMNTKGLKGALKGQSSDKDNSYSAYAYSKGIHVEEENHDKEKSRGGSHGIGKIASNAASDLYMMFFANCDELGNKHLGGTVQLIEHLYNGKYYRSTGYFTDESNQKYYPYKNEFHEVFIKDTRGLKIVIPYFREQFNNEEEIIKSICDNFFIAILEGKLVIKLNEKLISKNTISEIIFNDHYYEQNIGEMKKNFTPLYLDTYQNANVEKIIVKDKKKEYKFKLYFTYDELIQKGRVAVIRTIGMKIEDFRVKNNATKPFNAILIPESVEEDAFLKSLENESHTQIAYAHIKDKNTRSNAVRFINNLHKEIAAIISEYMRKNNPPDALINTKDILYTIEKQFKQDLSKTATTIRSKVGNKKKTVIKIKKDEYGKQNNKGKENKKSRTRRVKKDIGNDSLGEFYNIDPSEVERIVLKDSEHLRIDVSNNKKIKETNKCNLVFALVDGRGQEHFNEFKVDENYYDVVDVTSNQILKAEDNAIKNIQIEDGVLEIKAKIRDSYNRTLKFVYFMEV